MPPLPHATCLLGLVCVLVHPGAAVADGVVLDPNGHYVNEQQQHAFIEWHAGTERLFLATRTDPTAGPSVWLVPVPAAPETVRAEPAKLFPHAVGREGLGARD